MWEIDLKEHFSGADATGSGVPSSPALVNGIVYVGGYSIGLFALDASTGTLKWNYITGSGSYPNGVVSSPAVANGVVYVGSYDHKLYALDAATGAFKWSLHDWRLCDFQPGGGERCRLRREL